MGAAERQVGGNCIQYADVLNHFQRSPRGLRRTQYSSVQFISALRTLDSAFLHFGISNGVPLPRKRCRMPFTRSQEPRAFFSFFLFFFNGLARVPTSKGHGRCDLAPTLQIPGRSGRRNSLLQCGHRILQLSAMLRDRLLSCEKKEKRKKKESVNLSWTCSLDGK